jgi:hypothetical protein
VQDQGIGRDRRSGDFRISEVGFEADRVVTSRGRVTKSIQAVEFGATIFRLASASSDLTSYRIGSVPQRLRSRPPSAIAITTRISSGRGASATDTVIVSKCGKDQESSL